MTALGHAGGDDNVVNQVALLIEAQIGKRQLPDTLVKNGSSACSPESFGGGRLNVGCPC